jgi:hypothetical protein
MVLPSSVLARLAAGRWRERREAGALCVKTVDRRQTDTLSRIDARGRGEFVPGKEVV